MFCYLLVKKSRAAKRSRRIPVGLVALGERSTVAEDPEEAVAPVQSSVTSPYFSQPGNGVHVKEEKGNDSPTIEQIPSAKTRARKGKQQSGSRKRKRTALEEPAIAVKKEVLFKKHGQAIPLIYPHKLHVQ